MQMSGVWEGGAPVGGTFRVEWKRRVDLPFEATHQMYNPLNEGKPVRICRDGQEVPHELGTQLTRMMDQLAQRAGIPPPRPAAGAMQPAGGAHPLCLWKRSHYSHHGRRSPRAGHAADMHCEPAGTRAGNLTDVPHSGHHAACRRGAPVSPA